MRTANTPSENALSRSVVLLACGTKIGLEFGIQRDIAPVVAKEVELDFISAGTGQVKVVEVLTVRRHYRLVRHTVRVLPARCLWREEGAERLSVRL